MGLNVVSYCLSKKYANKLSCGISNSTYDPGTSTMTVNLNDGSSYGIVFDDGVTPQDREFLDNVDYDSTDNKLEINGVEVLTKEDAVSDDDNLNFDGWFD